MCVHGIGSHLKTVKADNDLVVLEVGAQGWDVDCGHGHCLWRGDEPFKLPIHWLYGISFGFIFYL